MVQSPPVSMSEAPVASTSQSTMSIDEESYDRIASLKESTTTPSSSTSTPTQTATIRGRPRSSSISNGSPSPSLGSTIPLPSLFPDNSSPTASPWSFKAAATTSISVVGPSPTSNRRTSGSQSLPIRSPNPGSSPTSAANGSSAGGWGHRPSLSVPGIVAPLPVPAGGVARGGRHRRTQSVSPPGFPVLSEQEISGFASGASTSSTSPTFVATPFASTTTSSAQPTTVANSSHAEKRKESPSRSAGSRPMSIPTSRITMPRAELSPIRHNLGSFSTIIDHSPSTSPTGSGTFHAPPFASSSPLGSPSHHAFSHAALLSGVRSHALNHHEPLPFSSSESRHSPLLMATSPTSPPFGPTSPNSHHPSPLALELHRSSPERELEDVLRRSRGDGLGLGMDDERPPLNPPRPGAVSPPLLPLPPIEGSPTTVGRPRSGSFGRDLSTSPTSPASRFLEKPSPPSTGHCDKRVTPEEQHRTSPPPESTLFFPTTSSPPFVPVPGSSAAPPSFSLPGSTLGFEPSTSSIFSPPSTSSATMISSSSIDLTLTPVPLSPPESTSSSSIDSTSVTSSEELQPPPSPHANTIALPPPHVAPAPLPPHLGGPLLHGSLGPRRKSRGASKMSLVAGADHVPKRHSPLAVVAVSEGGNSDGVEDEGDDAIDEDEEEELGLDRSRTAETRSTNAIPVLSPLGNPQHLEESSSSEAYQSLAEHLAATPSPPKSGWDMDDPEEDDFDEGFASGSPPGHGMTAPGLELGGGLEDAGYLALSRIARQERESPAVDRSPDALPPLPEPSGSGFGALDFVHVDHHQQQQQMEQAAASALGLLASQHSEMQSDEHEQHGVCAIDEESLSTLERIFVCAKSESSDERIRVGQNLPEWLLGVDICEAAEYVLPLLGGLATDPDDYVKEAFAVQLDRVMWYFFNQCPLIELENSNDHEHSHHHPHAPNHDGVTPAGSPVPSRYPTLHQESSNLGQSERSPTSTQFGLSDSAASSTPPPTSKTSPSNTEVADSPRISAATFTSLLGALLTDQSTGVAKSTEAALVRFLCRLKGKPVPVHSPIGSPLHDVETIPSIDETTTPTNATAQALYQLSLEARRLLEEEFVTGIVLGLARLDDDEQDSNQQHRLHESTHDVEDQSAKASSTNSSPHFVLSPEEDTCEDGWLNTDSGPFADSPLDRSNLPDDWGAPLTSFFNASPDLPSSTSDLASTLKSDSTSSPRGEPPMYSTFSPDPNHSSGDDEASIGKVVSMGLVSAIAATDCLEPETLAQQILPEVERMRGEAMFYVRREAAQALGSLARTLPAEVIESVVLPLHSAFAHDTLWHVRRAACLVLPAICKRLDRSSLRKHAVDHMKLFSSDSSRNVRSGALEVCGELTYLFYEDPAGVPDEILSIFLGQSISTSDKEADSTPTAPNLGMASSTKSLAPMHDEDDVFTPLANPLDSPPSAFQPTASTIEPEKPAPFDFAASARDPDRPVMCAFNFPAIVLTLGKDKWSMLQSYHAELCQHKTAKVRQSLASSLHEVAKIIGPEQADNALLEPFSTYLVDQDYIQGAILENLPSLLMAFGAEAGKAALTILVGSWDKIRMWRRRETLAKYLGELGAHFMLRDASDEIMLLVAKAFGDEVAAVREQAVHAIPRLIQAAQNDEEAAAKLWAFLSVFYSDSGYRNRATYATCVRACVHTGISRDLFETMFLQPLVQLAEDRVINVRIGVARVVVALCTSAQLYADPSTRAPLSEILHILAHSPDRDVKTPILPFYTSSSLSDTRSPSPNSMIVDRLHETRSRQQLYQEEEASSDMDEDDRPIPTATRSNPSSHGVHFDRVPLDDEESMTLDPSTSFARLEQADLGGDDDDAVMDFDDVKSPLPADSSSSPPVWSDMVDEEGGFVEVHQQRN